MDVDVNVRPHPLLKLEACTFFQVGLDISNFDGSPHNLSPHYRLCIVITSPSRLLIPGPALYLPAWTLHTT